MGHRHGFSNFQGHWSYCTIEVLTIAKWDNCSSVHLGIFGRGGRRCRVKRTKAPRPSAVLVVPRMEVTSRDGSTKRLPELYYVAKYFTFHLTVSWAPSPLAPLLSWMRMLTHRLTQLGHRRLCICRPGAVVVRPSGCGLARWSFHTAREIPVPKNLVGSTI